MHKTTPIGDLQTPGIDDLAQQAKIPIAVKEN